MSTLNRAKTIAWMMTAAVSVAACGNNGGDKPAEATTAIATNESGQTVSAKPAPAPTYDGTISKPGAPFVMSYKVIGTPIVGSPVTVNLRVTSTLGSQPLRVNYRTNDAAAMTFHEAQPLSIEMAPASEEDFVLQQVTVIPQREGRLYLNVTAAVETEEGSMSTTMAIPIQVGSGGRILEENGEVQTDEEGEAIRVLTPD
jgi:hypothetical protein